jgi:CRP-like cAMP-binding protein
LNDSWQKPLSICPLFQGIEPEQRQVMMDCLNPRFRSYKRTEVITLAGEAFKGVGVVLSGQVAVTKENTAGDRVIMALLDPGEMFGEMAAFAGNGVWPATVVAHDGCTVVFLPPEKIIGNCPRQCSSHRLLILNMLRVVSDKALMLNKKVEYLSMKSLRGKISAFLLEQATKVGQTMFMLPIDRNTLADFLNVSRPSLSREMGRMREEGVIDFHRASVRILDLEKLKQMAE